MVFGIGMLSLFLKKDRPLHNFVQATATNKQPTHCQLAVLNKDMDGHMKRKLPFPKVAQYHYTEQSDKW